MGLMDGPGVVTLGEGDRALATAAIKAVMKVTASEDDPLIAAFAEVALGLAERFTGQVAIQRAITETVRACRDWIPLAARPVQAITNVSGVDADGLPVVLVPGDYAIDLDGDGIGWVRFAGSGAVTRLTVSFQAGLAPGWETLPPPIGQGATLLAAHLYEARDEAAPPAAVTALWRPYRTMRLMQDVRS